MLQRFQDQYGIMKPALLYHSNFELLVAVVLSAQCTDERVNIVTADLFPAYDSPDKILQLGLRGLEDKIKTCGLYHSKAKNIGSFANVGVWLSGKSFPASITVVVGAILFAQQ